MCVIVTGAGGGIGLAVAERLSGAPIVIVDRNPVRGGETAARLNAAGGQAIASAEDIADPASAPRIVDQAVGNFGGIDAIVTAAGSIAGGAPLESVGDDAIAHLFAVNTLATHRLAQAAFPYLRASRGAIVAISSTGARHPVPGLGAYSASKAALTMLVRQMALEWGPHGIRANSIAPGPTVTPMAPAYADPAVRTRRAATIPLRRLSEANEIAAAVAFLLSPDAIGITGIELEIDGGMGLTTMQLSGSDLGRGAG